MYGYNYKMRTKMTLSIVLTSFLLSMCTAGQNEQASSNQKVEKASQTQLEELSKAYFASGCFWCVEAVFESVRGVEEAVSGYSGGQKQNPTYRQIGTGQTGHSETVEVYYDPNVVSYATLVEVFYGSHNPTTVNGQHPDYGSQYRSIIFYQNDTEKKIAETFKAKLVASGEYDQPIATEIVPLVKFWKAEDYHQDYEKLNPNNGYIRNVSIPRLRKFQKKFPELLKEGH